MARHLIDTMPPRCAGCDRGMVSRRAATLQPVPDGMTRHAGHGLCDACQKRKARGKPFGRIPQRGRVA